MVRNDEKTVPEWLVLSLIPPMDPAVVGRAVDVGFGWWWA
jgi:hypothetical protein